MNHMNHWCEYVKLSGVLCLRKAEVTLPVEIGEDDQQGKHGFCEFHAGCVIATALDMPDDQDESGVLAL